LDANILLQLSTAIDCPGKSESIPLGIVYTVADGFGMSVQLQVRIA